MFNTQQSRESRARFMQAKKMWTAFWFAGHDRTYPDESALIRCCIQHGVPSDTYVMERLVAGKLLRPELLDFPAATEKVW